MRPFFCAYIRCTFDLSPVSQVALNRTGPITRAHRLASGLIGLRSAAVGHQLWTLRRIRKPFACLECATWHQAGQQMYAPIGSLDNRSDRLCVACVDRLIQKAG